MKKNKLYKFIIMMVVFAFFTLISNSSKAASITINTSKTKVSPGEKFSVTVSVSGGAGKVNVSATNATLSKSELDLMLQSSITITCTAGNSGIISINANGIVADYSTEKDTNISATPKSVTIVQKNSGNGGNSSNSTTGNNGGKTDTNTGSTTKSNVATLSNLGIRPNDFSGFNANKTSYSTEVPNNVESIEIYAEKAKDNNGKTIIGQKISGTGKKTLKEGTNSFSVVVTSEDGTNQKTYTINVTRKTKDEQTEGTEKPEEKPEETPEENSEEQPMEETFGLSELKIEGLELNPKFQTDIYEYNIELKKDLEKLNITTLATKENSNIEITGNENLQEGENIITIIVKGENDAETVAYQIIVNKILEKQEDTSNREQQEKIKKIIILSVAGGIILIIAISVVIIKIKKSKGLNAGYIPYEDLNDDYEETNEIEEQPNEDVEDEFYEEETRKKKHSKGKRFK